MIYKTTPFTESTDVSAVLADTANDALFPKIVYASDGTYQVLNNAADQTTYEGAPFSTPEKVLYPAADLGLEFGADYGIAIFLSRNANYIFSRDLPAPTLTVTETAGVPTLEWTSAYMEPTKVYRTDVYTGTQPQQFTLIAEVDGYTTSGGTSTYTDTITLAVGESVAYFVENANGASDEVAVERTA